MKITMKESTMVKPMEETPSGSVWLSSLDLIFPATYHTRWVNFYSRDGADNFLDAEVLKAALSRALIEFYPYAGRLRKDDNGRIEINCNGEGVLFLEAECDGTLADLGGFNPRPDISFVAKVDYSNGISAFPLSLMQLTRFKCGGVSLGICNQHQVSDGMSALHFINTWSDIARGLTTAVPPSLNRRVLSARNPPRPLFPHIEHHPPPPLKSPLLDSESETTFSTLRLSRKEINALKQRCKSNYSTYEVVAGHVWRCVSIARGLAKDQVTRLQLPVNARRRLRPPLPEGYFGNAIFITGAYALCGELESNPLSFAVGKVHEAIDRMDDEYLRSALDYVELKLSDGGIVRSERTLKCPNLGVTSWIGLPFYEADFGWGKPVYSGSCVILPEGKSYLSADPDPENEGGVLLTITLHKHHMNRFQNFLYDDNQFISSIISKI